MHREISVAVLVLAVVAIVSSMHVGNYIKFETKEGTTCGCLVDDNVPPTMEQCEIEGLEDPVIIEVSKC